MKDFDKLVTEYVASRQLTEQMNAASKQFNITFRPNEIRHRIVFAASNDPAYGTTRVERIIHLVVQGLLYEQLQNMSLDLVAQLLKSDSHHKCNGCHCNKSKHQPQETIVKKEDIYVPPVPSVDHRTADLLDSIC
jgi:hypothetical protein